MDTHGMKFELDTSDVAKGFRDYRSAVEGIFNSLDKFEAHVKKTMAGVAKASANPQALNAFKKSVQAFSNVDIDTSAAKKLSALSAAMTGFKAPSASQATNTKKFFTSLGGLPDLSAAIRSIKAIASVKDAMANFKAPSATHAKNLAAFGAAAQRATPGLMALSKISGISSIANELASISMAMRNLKAPNASQVTNLGNLALALRSFNFANLAGSGNFYAALGAISNFKAPSAAQIRNLQSFVTAVGNMRVPPNAAGVAAALNQIAAAANRAGLSLGGLRAGMGGLGGSLSGVGSNAHRASIQMMGLQNAFSGTFQVGSLLRSLLGSLTIAELGRNFFEASGSALQFQAQMSVLSKDVAFANEQLRYVNETANKFGTDMLAAEAGFGKISIAADKAGMSFMQTRNVFEGFSSAMTVLGVTTAGQGDVWLALQQVMNKGYLSAEELNQQLNEKLPGAMAYAGEYAKKLGVTLEKGLKTKVLDAQGVLDHMAKRMKEDFGPAVALALQRPQAQMNILRNNINMLFQAIGNAGGNKAFADFLANINAKLTPDAIQRYATAIGEGLSNAVGKLSDAFNWLYTNWDSIKGPLSTTLDLMGRWMIVSSALQIGRFLVMPLMQIGGAVTGLRATAVAINSLVGGTAAAGAAATGAAGATGRLGAAAAAATGGVTALRASLVGFIANTGASMLAAHSAAGAFARLGLAAGGAAVSGISKLSNFIGGPYLATLGLATYAAYQMYKGHEDNQQVVYESADAIAAIREKIDAATSSIYLNTTGVGTNTGQQSFLSTALSTASGFMDSYTIKLDQATGGLYSMAAAARTAAIENLKLAQTDITGKLAEAKMQSSGAIYQQSKNLWSQGRYALGAGGMVLAGAKQFGQTIGYSAPEKDARANIRNWESQQADIAAKIAAAEKTNPLDIANEMKRRGVGGGVPQGPKTADGSGGRKKKTGAGKSAEDQANSLENTVDTLMKKLTESDPLGKLYTDFVKTLTDEAHVLLNNNGYKQFLANIKADAADGQVTVESLIKTLSDGGNLSGKTMADLKKRYGEDVSGVIEMLRQQQAAYEDSIKEATIKSLDTKYKTTKQALDALGDSIPGLKAVSDQMDNMTKVARLALSPTMFTTWATGMRSGTASAKESMDSLTGSIMEQAGKTPVLDALLKRLGITAQDLADTVQKSFAVTEFKKQQDIESAKFGATILRQRQEEIVLNSLTQRDAEIMATLQQEVNRYVAEYGTVSQTKIDQLHKELIAQQDLGDQMKRNREFFENNGVRGYINDVKSAGQAVNELDKNVLQSLEDQLFNLGKTGEFSFTAIFDTIQDGMLRFASQNITKGLMEAIIPKSELEGGTPSLFGGMFKAMGFDTGAVKTAPLGSSAMNAMYVTWAGQGVGVTPDGRISSGIVNGQEPGTSALSPLYVTETNVGAGGLVGGGNSLGLGELSAPLTTNRTPVGQNFDEAFKNFPAPADPQVTIDKATAATATSFSTTLGNMMPMIGMAFAGSFKSPIAQVGAMFLSMMMQQMMTSQAGGGGGGLGGLLGGLFGGGGGGGGLLSAVSSAMGANAGIFKEGGFSNSAVSSMMVSHSAFANAPHYAEGTPNTSGGMPAILHDNEAVIPLSRGRKIPVEMAGGGRGQSINNNFNISSPDADSFRKSRQQIATEMHMSAGRAFKRNHG